MNRPQPESPLAELLHFSFEPLNRRVFGVEGSLATVASLAPIIPLFPDRAGRRAVRRLPPRPVCP